MSWKGFQKGIARTPQTLRQKMHKGQTTTDLVYADAERRFYAIEAQAKKLQVESKKYTEAINKMLYHQIQYSKVIEELYKPISGVLSDPNAPVSDQTNPEAIAACQQYRHLMEELQALLKPDLDMVETQIYQPCEELVTLVDSIKKIMTKRSHKQLDLDRHSLNLKKVQDRDDRNAKQEEKMFKVENEYEIALEEYNYFNELLKAELPQLFSLEGQFIKPLFESFYFMQLNVFYTMQTHLEEMKIPYFDLEGDIVEKFNAKRGNVLTQTEAIPLVHFARKPESSSSSRRHFLGRGSASPNSPASPSSTRSHRFGGSGGETGDPAAAPAQTWGGGPRRFAGTLAEEFDNEPLPAYSQQDVNAGRSGSGRSSATGGDDELKPNLPNRRSAAVPQAEFCTALYDYKPQSGGELEIRVGDRIEVLDRSEGATGWWTGRIGKEEGYFPGSYVKLE